MDREPQIQVFRIAHSDGSYIEVSNLGARWLSWVVPDGNGKYSDILLGYPTVLDYLQDDCYMGAIVGRFANRIGGATFSLEDHEYTLEKNDGANTNHGGYSGFHSKIWKGSYEGNKIVFRLSSAHLEGGYPGNVEVTVSYSFTSDGMVSIDFDGVSDRLTVLNLTNHAYFNLSGDGKTTILDHQLTLNADYYTPVDSTFMTTGEIAPVEGTPMDFRTATAIGARIDNYDFEQLKNGHGYDHNYVLNTQGDISQVAAKVYDPKSGRTLEVYTNEPGIQFYAGNFLDGTVKGKHGIYYPLRSALCLETQHYPDSPNKADWPSVVVRPGEKYHSTCIYKFGAE